MKALVVDFGGVLTTPLTDSVGAWLETDGIDPVSFTSAIGAFFGPEALADNPVHALEKGELAVPDFERRLAERLAPLPGRSLRVDGMLDRMFAGFAEEPAMTDVVRRAKAKGLKTALLSNSWGNTYPREGWAELFDVVVISGEVGMRKPDPDIFEHCLQLLGLPAEECVFVDDLGHNIKGAEAVGMVGVHHTSVDATVAELDALLDLGLAGKNSL